MKVDVREVRKGLGLSREKFSNQFGLDIETIRNYECGRRKIHGPTRLLFMIIAQAPDVVRSVVATLVH